MTNVALISMEPASSAVSSTRLMSRALEALADANAEVLAFTSSSYRQSFCFLVRKEELGLAMKSLEADLALELTHGYLKPIEVDEERRACWRWSAKACAELPGWRGASSARSRSKT